VEVFSDLTEHNLYLYQRGIDISKINYCNAFNLNYRYHWRRPSRKSWWVGNEKKLWCYFGDVTWLTKMAMTSLKWRQNWFFEVRFRHNQLENHNLTKSRNFRLPVLKVKVRWIPSAWRFC